MNREAKGLLIPVFIGIILVFVMSYFNIKNIYDHKDFIKVKARFIGNRYSHVSDSGDDMYFLIYEYEVDGKEYNYKTDYTTSVIPKMGSTIKIKYNPDNPSDVYNDGFNVYSIFFMIGIMFIAIPMMMLFSKIRWLRDIILIFFTAILMFMFILSNIGLWLIFVLCILGIMCYGGIYDLRDYIKHNIFDPIGDIRNEIEISKEIRKQKKLEKLNATSEEKERMKKRIKKIIIGLLMFIIPIPSVIIFEMYIGFPNEIIYIIFCLIAAGIWMAGFGIFVTAAFMYEEKDTTLIIAGEAINPEIIENKDKLTLKEKIKGYRIIETIISILCVTAFLAGGYFIFEDPYKIFQEFEFVARAQMFTFLILMIIITIIFILIGQIHLSKTRLALLIGGYVLLFLLFYGMTIPEDEYREVYNINEFKTRVEKNNFTILNENKIGDIDNKNCKVIVAKNDNDIKLYYILCDSRKSARKIDDGLDDNGYGDCSDGGLSSVSENRKEVRCRKPEYIRISYKIKNTLMVAESNNLDEEKILNDLLYDMGYNKSDYGM